MQASITTPIGKIFQPVLDAVGGVLAFFYSIIPNYPIDVALLTIVIMALLTPLTVKSTKNMAAMQALGPEMKKLQQKYKGAENRAQMNEEMMKLYKEHNVNPASGCLPMLLQMPAFFVLYSVVRGITNTVTVAAHTVTKGGLTVDIPAKVTAVPRYIPKDSKMYHNIVAAHGQLISFGMDFSDKLLSHHSSIFVAIPYLLLVVASVGLQYLQMSRLNARNKGAAQANPQAAMLQKYMPLIFGFIYINVAAILNVYFIVSSAIRIATQEILFRKGMVGGPPKAPIEATATSKPKGPAADRTERALPKPKTTGSTSKASSAAKGAGAAAVASNGKAGGANGKTPAKSAGTAQGARPATKRAATPARAANGTSAKKAPAKVTANGSARNGTAKKSTSNSSSRSAEEVSESQAEVVKEHPRSKAKRERKARE
jgi:YidC/Oxa1 family membrane protein insertase